MPTTDIQVSNLKINVLTEEQYEQIQNPSNTELYLVPEVVDTVPTEDSTNTITSGAVYDAVHNAKTIQTPVTDPTASGTSITFIDSIAQNANGEITPTKKTVQSASPSSSGVGGQAGLMSATDKEKLDGVASGAEVNVQSDWNQTNSLADDYIKNKPVVTPPEEVPYIIYIYETPSGSGVVYSCSATAEELHNNLVRDHRTPLFYFKLFGSDEVCDEAAIICMRTDMFYTTSFDNGIHSSGEGNLFVVDEYNLNIEKQYVLAWTYGVEDFEDGVQVRFVGSPDLRADWNQSTSNAYNYIKNKPTIPSTAADVNAIPTSEKGAANGVAELDSNGKVPSSQLPSYVDDVLEYVSQSAFPATGESGKIYIAQDTNKTYRWSGSAYVEISESLALGETSSTAYRGDRGKTAYDHSQVTDGSNPHNTTFANIADKPTTISGYGITDAFSGSYNDLTNKPTIPAAGIPSGGNAGQVLKKASATDYDVHWANASETLPSAYCTTSGSTAAKKANCSLYVTQANQYLQVLIGSANTYQGALTLNINSAGAKPIYINGTASSSSNYTLPNGTYFVFYDGTNYYFRTDGKLPMKDAAFGGSYNDLADKPTIPDVTTKADKVSSATSGNLASLDSNGNLTDSGSKASDFLTQHQDISGKANKSEMSVVDGTGSDADKTTITLKTGTSATVLKSHQDISGKQDVINSSNKLSADYIVDGTTNKVINVKPDWNAASGTDAEILNKPTIPAAQVNSDWNASSGVAQILNKPTIPSAINDLSDVTVSSPTNGQVLKYNSTSQKFENAADAGGATITLITWTNS